MGQIIGGAAKPKRCNLNQLSQLGTPAAGEHILVSSDNSMNAAGQGNFDCYIVGDGIKAASTLPLHKIDEKIYDIINSIKSNYNDDEEGDFKFSDKYGNLVAVIGADGIKATDFVLPDGNSILSKTVPYVDDENDDFKFSDKYGNLVAILGKDGIKAVDFVFPDGESVLDKIASSEIPVVIAGNNIVEMLIGGHNGKTCLCDENSNIALLIDSDGKTNLLLSEKAFRHNVDTYGTILYEAGKDFDFDAPSYVFGIESGTRTGREYFTEIYPESLLHESIPALIDGSKKAVMQFRKPQTFTPQDIRQELLRFSIGGNGYRKKDFSVNYIRANRNLAEGKTIGMLAIGDSITGIITNFPATPISKYGRGTWQDWLLSFSVMDNKDVPTIPVIKAIGTKNYHPYSIDYDGETLNYYGHAEGVSGWSTYCYLNYPVWARLDDAYEDVQGNRKNRLDGEAMYYAAGLATETPYDSDTAGHAFVAWEEGVYNSQIVHTPMGRFKPDCCEALWNALKSLFTDFYNSNQGSYNGATSDAIMVAYLDNFMDNPINPFYDKGRARAYTGSHQWTYTNAFSLAKYLERYRNCDDEGNPLVGSAGEVVVGADGNTYTIGTNLKANSQVFMPTHVISALGTNDGSMYLECQMELLNTLAEQGVPHVGHWRPRRAGVINPQLWNEYGYQYKLTAFLYEENNAIMDAIGPLDINNVINYIPAYFTASPVSAGFMDAQAYDLDYIDKVGVVSGDNTVHPSAFYLRSAAYQCLAWIYWTLQ